MDEAESMIGMSDDDSSNGSGANNGEDVGGGGGGGVSLLVADSNDVELQQQNHNGDSNSDLLNVALEEDDGVVDDDDEDDDDDDVMNPVTAASALRQLVGSVGVELSSLGGNQNHLHNSQSSSLSQQQSPEAAPTRYLQVEGYDGRRNDIIFCTPLRDSKNSSSSISTCENANNHEHEESSSTEEPAEEGGDAQSSLPKGCDDEGKTKILLFFGGDIQDFPEMMEQHRDHRNYVQFNLEATALQLQKQFPDHHIAVVRPSRIQMLTFSCYDNFVHCNHTGAPEHVITHHSLHHLELLLQNLSKRIVSDNNNRSSNNKATTESVVDCGSGSGLNIKNQVKSMKEGGGGGLESGVKGKSNYNSNNDEDSTVSSTTVDESSSTNSSSGGGEVTSSAVKGEGNQCNNSSNSSTTNGSSKLCSKKAKIVRLDRADIRLVGFSKGCVVLNQLLYEFHYLKTLTPDDLSMNDFLTCIKDMYWLDGGHNGGKNTWITSRSLLETLTRLGVRIHVHLTPYQLLDDRRPWIRKEEKLFSELLKKFSAPIIRQIHFENETPCLQQHLRIIGDFNMHPLPHQHLLLQHSSLHHRSSNNDDEVDGGNVVVEGVGVTVENHKQVVNVVGGGGGESNHENNMELEH